MPCYLRPVQQLSAVIITHNEERNIGRCIASVQDVVDEVVVVDSFSTDATAHICLELGVRFVQRAWDGYSPQRNYAVELAANNWVLAIDADEALSDELRKSILEAKKEGTHRNFKFNRLTNYCGTWIHHSGWYPDTKFRLFDRRESLWQGVIHEQLSQPKTEVRKLKGDLLHYSYSSILEHVTRTKHYAMLSAMELRDAGVRPTLLKVVFSPCIKFIKFYLVNRGFLDGYSGLVISAISAYGTFVKYANHRALARKTAMP